MAPPVFQGFMKSLGVIFASEIGDKTFFVAAIMAMQHPRLLVFIGCAGALVIMTILSTAFGAVAPALIPPKYTHYASIVLFVYFGLMSLWQAFFSKEEGQSELEEVEAELGSPKNKGRQQMSAIKKLVSPVVVEAFVMTFLGEWGDRSQITTISLAAAHSPVGVTLGGGVGHLLCTLGAVVGGKQLASVIDPRTVNIVGGILFLGFGAWSWYEGPENSMAAPAS